VFGDDVRLGIPRGARQEGGTGQAAAGGLRVYQRQQAGIKCEIGAHGATGVQQQGNHDRNVAVLDARGRVRIGFHVGDGTRGGKRVAALQRGLGQAAKPIVASRMAASGVAPAPKAPGQSGILTPQALFDTTMHGSGESKAQQSGQKCLPHHGALPKHNG
jgi:hypothetical protein